MSQSPDDTAEQTSVDQLVKYRNGWSALSQLIGKGRSFSGYERNCCFLNLGDGRFVDTSATTDLDLIDDGRAVALTDWNFDGAVDLWVANRTAPRVRFLQNQTDSTHPWLAIRLQGVTCNRDAIGARVEVHRPDSLPTLIKTLHAGDGYLSQSTKWVHFGLGKSERIAKVVVRWPGAKSQTFTGIRSNRHYRIVQGAKSATQLPVKTRSSLKPSPIDLPKPEASSRTWVQGRLLIPKSEYQTFDQQPASIDAFLGTPLLLNLWSANCQPCLTELNDWAHEFAFDRLQVLALSIDHFELDRSQAIQRSTTVLKSANAKSKGAKISGGLATERLIENLEAVQRTYLELQQPLPIPSSFLLDQRGQIAAIYKGPVTAKQIKQDLKLLNVPKQKQRMAAVPFPGKFASQPFPALPMAIAKTLDSPQDPKRADDYLLRYVSRLCDDFSAKQRTLTTEENNSLASVIQTLIERLQSRGQLDRIDGTLKRLLTVASGNAALHRSIATALVRKGIAKRALPHFEAAFSAYENDSSFLNQMAFAEMGAQEFDSAISHYQRSLELRPDPVTHFHLGNAFQKLQNIPQAVVHFRTAMQMRPTWMLPANNLAWILATNRQHQDAKEAVKISESICREPTNRTPSALSTLAVAYAASSNFDKAISANQQAIKLAEQRGMVSLVEKLKNRSELFRNEQPYFE